MQQKCQNLSHLKSKTKKRCKLHINIKCQEEQIENIWKKKCIVFCDNAVTSVKPDFSKNKINVLLKRIV